MIDEDAVAVKPSPGVGFEGQALLRVTDVATNVQLHFPPDEALRIGRALVEVALDLGATP